MPPKFLHTTHSSSPNDSASPSLKEEVIYPEFVHRRAFCRLGPRFKEAFNLWDTSGDGIEKSLFLTMTSSLLRTGIGGLGLRGYSKEAVESTVTAVAATIRDRYSNRVNWNDFWEFFKNQEPPKTQDEWNLLRAVIWGWGVTITINDVHDLIQSEAFAWRQCSECLTSRSKFDSLITIALTKLMRDLDSKNIGVVAQELVVDMIDRKSTLSEAYLVSSKFLLPKKQSLRNLTLPKFRGPMNFETFLNFFILYEFQASPTLDEDMYILRDIFSNWGSPLFPCDK